MTNFPHELLACQIDLFSRWANRQLLDRSLPGLSIALIHDQQVVWKTGFGHADLQLKMPTGVETIYGIGSITKVFTAIAILQLRDKRELDLDRQVSDYLSWFNVSPYEDKPCKITIRHLLLHTSGLPPNLVVPGSSSGPTPTVEELEKFLPKHECLSMVGDEPHYSNLGYIILGQIIEKISGKSYAEYIKGNILDPLNMNQTGVGHAVPNDNVAKGYGRYLPQTGREILLPVEMHTADAAGGIRSTLEDLTKLARPFVVSCGSCIEK